MQSSTVTERSASRTYSASQDFEQKTLLYWAVEFAEIALPQCKQEDGEREWPSASVIPSSINLAAEEAADLASDRYDSSRSGTENR